MNARSLRLGRPRFVATAVVVITMLATTITGVPTGAEAAEGGQVSAPIISAPAGDGIQGSYIIVLDQDASSTNAAGLSSALESKVNTEGGQITQRYRSAITGFATEGLNAQALAALSASPAVAYIQQDLIMRKTEVQQNPTWGLDRIDEESLPLDRRYRYDHSGDGVTVYVLDTGLRATHRELAGRVAGGTSFVGGSALNDCDGHGTHVAGTVAATTWGVAKDARIYALRVLNCSGSGPLSATIGALDWVAGNAATPAVVNMSLGGGFTRAMDSALAGVRQAGVTTVVAAGNSNASACSQSPAHSQDAITVAASTTGDARAGFSNWGSCVDIFAPGTGIRSLGNINDSSTATFSGTSMASPHVAGVAALYLGANPAATPAQVRAAILGGATTGKVSNRRGSPDLLLYSLLTNSPPPPPPTTTTTTAPPPTTTPPPPPTTPAPTTTTPPTTPTTTPPTTPPTPPPPPAADPTVSVDPLTVTETNRNQSVRVTFRLDGPAAGTTRVRFATQAGTATRNQDYNRRTGTVTFTAGQTVKTATLIIRGDQKSEPTEQFQIVLSNPTGVQLGRNGIVTILDNDEPGPTVSVDSTTVTETDRSQALTITFRLSEPASATTRVRFMTEAGTATRNRDYTRRAGTILFRPGQTTRTSRIIIRGDRTAEPTESFSVTLNTPVGLQLGAKGTITILDND